MAIDAAKTQRILDAAQQLFARYGFRKTSIDEIAREAAVGKGTVYLVAHDKEDLFYQVVHRELRAWLAEVSPLVDPRRPADELLATVTAAALGYLERRPLVRDLLIGNHDDMLPLWTQRLDDLRAICRQNTEEVLRIGLRQGIFRPDLDVERAGRVLQELLIAGMVFAYKTKKPIDDGLRDSVLCLQLLLEGLKVRP
jgi:AcrR family transcriptional regulator